MKSHVMSKELSDYVQEARDASAEDDIKNEEAKHLIYVSMEPQEIAATGVYKTAYQLWTKIQENHEGSEHNLQSIALAEFLSLKYQKGETLVNYAGRFEIALGKLEATDFKVDEKTKLWVLSNTRPPYMKNTVQMFDMARQDGKVTELIAQLKLQFHLDSNETKKGSAAYNTKESDSQTHRQNPYHSANNQGNSKQKTMLSCNYCKKVGHLWKECRKLKRDKERKRHYNQQKPKQENSGALSAKSHTFSEDKNTWIVDSGATSHMTPYREYFTSFQKLTEPHLIYLGDGRKLEAHGQGNVQFTSNRKTGSLTSILWVPDIKENLFSVCRAIEQGVDVKLSSIDSSVSFMREGRQVLKGYKKIDGRCYLLNLQPINGEYEDQALIGASLEERHKRFSHCSMDTIRNSAKQGLVEGLTIADTPKHECYACGTGKLCRSHHPSRRGSRADEETAVLHIDTVGSMRGTSPGGSRYFILGTEEYSNYKMIETLSMKSIVPDSVKRMINKTEIISKRPVKCIVTDDEIEYTNHDLENFLKRRGIAHSYAASYTSEQNGRAERANSHTRWSSYASRRLRLGRRPLG